MSAASIVPNRPQLELVKTVSARRRWSREEKLRIVAESSAGRRAAAETARRYGLSMSQLFAWRRLSREGRLMEPDEPEAATASSVAVPSMVPPADAGAGQMEIIIGDVRIIVDTSIDSEALARVAKAFGR